MRISRRGDLDWNSVAAAETDLRSVRSRGRYVIGGQFGTEAWISWIAVSAFERVRAARKISLGLCLASWWIDSLPRPVFPGLYFSSG